MKKRFIVGITVLIEGGRLSAKLVVLAMALIILTNVKIFQFPHSAGCIIWQLALYGKEKLIAREYKHEKIAA